MADEITSTTLAGLVEDISANTIYLFNSLAAGLLESLQIKDSTGIPGKTAAFPKYSTVASSDVAETAEGTDVTSNMAVTNADVDATLAEHVIMATITDMTLLAAHGDIVDDVSRLFANGIKAKLEDDIVGLLTGFSQTVAGAGTTFGEAHVWSARQLLQAASAPMNDIYGILSPKQYYGAKGLRAFMLDVDGPMTQTSEDWRNKGGISSAFGIKWLISNEIDENVASGDDAAGGMYAKGAIGLHIKSMPGDPTFIHFGIERNESLRGFQLVATGRWGQVELVDTFGVYCLSDIA